VDETSGSGEWCWFIAEIVATSKNVDANGKYAMRKESALFYAPSVEESYDKAERLGHRRYPATQEPVSRDLGEETGQQSRLEFLGVWNFREIFGDAPEDGVELTWYEEELSPADLGSRVRARDDLSVFQVASQPATGWYIAEVVLEEVHDEGSHGDHVLVWVNFHLIAAADASAAYQRAQEVGARYTEELGSHKCDGEKAHWVFIGLQDLYPCMMAPGDERVLWSEDFLATAAARAERVPTREQEFHRFKNPGRALDD